MVLNTDNRPMHILFITSYYPSQEAPITGIFFHEQAMALHKFGHKVGVLVTPRLNVTIDYLKREGISNLRATTRETSFVDFPVYRMHWGWFPRPLPFIIAPLLASAGAKAFDSYVHEHGMPDVIHAQNIFYAGCLASNIKAVQSIPIVLTEHSSSFLENLIVFPGQGSIIKRTLKAVDVTLVVGRSLIQPLRRYVPEQNIDVIGNIVDTDFFSPSSEPLPATPFKFLVIAQLKERRKGFDVLLQAFAKAFKGRTDVLLQIRGHGPLRPELDKLIEELGIRAQVTFLPMMLKEQLRDLIRQSHSLVSSSFIETFGVSIAEAIACGRPVVSTISGGPEDFVTERSGILVPAGNVSAFAEALQKMVTNYDHYRPEEIRTDIVARYSEAAYVKQLTAAYDKVIAR